MQHTLVQFSSPLLTIHKTKWNKIKERGREHDPNDLMTTTCSRGHRMQPVKPNEHVGVQMTEWLDDLLKSHRWNNLSIYTRDSRSFHDFMDQNSTELAAFVHKCKKACIAWTYFLDATSGWFPICIWACCPYMSTCYVNAGLYQIMEHLSKFSVPFPAVLLRVVNLYLIIYLADNKRAWYACFYLSKLSEWMYPPLEFKHMNIRKDTAVCSLCHH